MRLFSAIILLSCVMSCGDGKRSGANSDKGSQESPRLSPTPNPVPGSTNPPSPKASKSGQQGDFSYEQKPVGSYFVTRYKHKGNVLTRAEFLGELIDMTPEGKNFRELFNTSISSLATIGTGVSDGYQIQAPVINKATKDFPFYLLIIEASGLKTREATYQNYLFHCDPQPTGSVQSANYTSRFWQLFAFDQAANAFATIGQPSFDHKKFGAAVFKGGVPVNPEEILISPCPVESDILGSAKNIPLWHIHAFSKMVADTSDPNNNMRLHSFWYAVGKTAQQMFDGATVKDLNGAIKSQLFLNTHGRGVGYLHFRVENKPLHYHQVADLKDEAKSKSYYEAVFK